MVTCARGAIDLLDIIARGRSIFRIGVRVCMVGGLGRSAGPFSLFKMGGVSIFWNLVGRSLYFFEFCVCVCGGWRGSTQFIVLFKSHKQQKSPKRSKSIKQGNSIKQEG